MDIVRQTASKVGVSVPFIFRRAVEGQHFTNEREIIKLRLSRFISHCEVPDYVRLYCEQLQATVAECVAMSERRRHEPAHV